MQSRNMRFGHKLTASEAHEMDRQFEADSAAGLWLAVNLPERAFDLCADLGRRHGPRLGLRTLDRLHVASALELKAESF